MPPSVCKLFPFVVDFRNKPFVCNHTLCLTGCRHRFTSTSHQMMGHLCLTAATGIARPFLTRLLITPWGHRKGQWRQSCSFRLRDTKSDSGPLSISSRGNGCEPLLQFRDTLKALRNVVRLEALGSSWGQCVYDFMSTAGACEVNADELFLVMYPQANCPAY